LQKTYQSTYIRGDGQVVKIDFVDNVSFEIVPCFVYGNFYVYPDTNAGGKWKFTKPKLEINEINNFDHECNGNLKNLCRMTRCWKENCNVLISGFLIDTLAYNFFKKKRKTNMSNNSLMVSEFFNYLKSQDRGKNYWLAPGSKQKVYRRGMFEHKALLAYKLSIKAITAEIQGDLHLANSLWKEIYGSKF